VGALLEAAADRNRILFHFAAMTFRMPPPRRRSATLLTTAFMPASFDKREGLSALLRAFFCGLRAHAQPSPKSY
jgi:hypothetical protein